MDNSGRLGRQARLGSNTTSPVSQLREHKVTLVGQNYCWKSIFYKFLALDKAKNCFKQLNVKNFIKIIILTKIMIATITQ